MCVPLCVDIRYTRSIYCSVYFRDYRVSSFENGMYVYVETRDEDGTSNDNKVDDQCTMEQTIIKEPIHMQDKFMHDNINDTDAITATGASLCNTQDMQEEIPLHTSLTASSSDINEIEWNGNTCLSTDMVTTSSEAGIVAMNVRKARINDVNLVRRVGEGCCIVT